MRNLFIAILFVTIICSCAKDDKNQLTAEEVVSTGDLAQIKQLKSLLNEKKTSILSELEILDAKIKELSPEEKKLLVTTINAETEKFDHFLEIQGYVDTKKNIIIYPEYSGLLKRVYVKNGQKVARGQILGDIDDAGLKEQISQAKIQLGLLKTTYDRQKKLWDQKIGSEIQFLQAQSNYEAQRKLIAQLNNQINKTNVYAPFTGVIDEVLTEQGTVVGAGQTPLFRIVNLSEMFIETDVPETYIKSVTKGKQVMVEFPVLGESLETKVSLVSSYINPANRTFRIELKVPNKNNNIKPNLTAKLKINDYTNEEAILIPQNVISEDASGKQYIYTLKNIEGKNAKAHKQFITTGLTKGDKIEIIEGLKTGDKIIEKGARSVKENQKVNVLES